ncbi:leucine-rich PPR motif-containing protein, mitochondrial isoform X1 [Leptinotarsa decemlineata]|uniref:leucine-rich PPR motif-containing protein, mitochondrial isoform X1 n=1 Tax=Leptinotarsa decemlineata TaxID=7539 RepID=UPI003D306593
MQNCFRFRYIPKNGSLLGRVYKMYSVVNSSSWGFNALEPRRTLNVSTELEFLDDKKKVNWKLFRESINSLDFKTISNDDGKILLRYCGSSAINSSRKSRNELCQTIYDNILEQDKVDLKVYYSYIKTCTENGILLNWREFLSNLKHKPDEKIHKLLLENVCDSGAIEEAFSILEEIKYEGYSVDEDVFASLLLGHTLKGGLKAAESVLLTMRTAQIPETNNTKLAILKGLLRRKNHDDFKKFLNYYPLKLDEKQLLNILQELGLNGEISWLQEMNTLYDTMSREFTKHLKDVCIHLVHNHKAKNAMKIYENFISDSMEDNYGIFILEEMLLCNIEADEVISLTKYLRDKGMNQFAFERLTEFALRNKYVDVAWSLLKNINELRPHFFWPLLVIAHQVKGECGVLEVIQNMIKMNVRPDSDTLEYYVLPFCNLDNAKHLIQKLVNLGFSVKQLLTSVLLVLLQYGKVKDAANLCNFYKVDIGGDILFKQILTSWSEFEDASSTVTLLQKYCESYKERNDLVGDFLVSSLKYCENTEDFEAYNRLLEVLKEKKLKITITSADILHNILKTCESAISEDIQRGIDDIVDFKTKPESSYIPHPREMTLEELECHLLELQEKNMETRGVLRRLIQLHSRLGNAQRAEQLRQIFSEAGYIETLGMKSSMMHSYINGGHLEPALDTFKEINKLDPNFNIDSFKLLDLATLLVKANRYSEAIEIVQPKNQIKVLGGPAILRNCLELLKAYKDENEQNTMFDLLVDEGYCKVNNIILGPLVRIHLINGNLEKAAATYIFLSRKHKCTPLQLEVIKEIGKTENETLLQKVLDATAAVHGYDSTQAVLITAFAENGQKKALNKVLTAQRCSFQKALEKRCERWVQERKLEALLTLASCTERLSKEVIDINFIFRCIMKIHSINNDCESAVKFYEYLLMREMPISREILELLNKLLKYNNYELPLFSNK